MNLRQLEVLRALVESGTTTGAAQRVRLTQSAVSRSLAGLEAELGFRIFDRVKHRLVLSEEGTAFFQEAERLLSGLDELQNFAREIREERWARLRIVAMPTVAYGLLPEALTRFLRLHERVSVSVEIRRRAEVTRWVAGRQFDVGFARLPIEYPGVTSQHLITVRAIAAVPANHKLARLTSIAPSDLEHVELIGLASDTIVQSKINAYFQEHGVAPKVKIDSSSLLSVCQFVAAGLGCGIVDPFAAGPAKAEGIAFRPLRPELRIEYGTLFRRHRTPSPLVRDLCAHVKAVAIELNEPMGYPVSVREAFSPPRAGASP
ncbi:MAG TPA: LysR substrate-binding domain-containing protein [Bryobacteraceae bacterium]|jgi:DNA-binding transcriptional LysR family regulator